MLKPAFVNSCITYSLKRPKTAVHCPVYIAGCEKKEKWCWSLNNVKTLKLIPQ